MKKGIKTVFLFTVSVGVSLFLSNSCSNKKQDTEMGFNFTEIDSLIRDYQLEKAISKIDLQKGLTQEDDFTLKSYLKFLNRLIEINNQLNEDDKKNFVKQVVDFQKGNYDNTILFADAGSKIYHGREFINGQIGLLKEPQKMMITCSYDDKYYYHVFTDISIEIDGRKINLAKGSPANGFREDGHLKTRPFEFVLTDLQIEDIINSKEGKIILTTAQTYNDRAYINNAIWDIKGGEKVKYNNLSDFKIRKEQILEKGEVKKFEIMIKEDLKERLDKLYEIHKILKRSKIKPIS